MKTLEWGDKVTFKVGDEVLKYEVRADYLNCVNGARNYEVFKLLGMTKDKERLEFASKIYGYEVTEGDWPCFKDEDYAAATELVKAVYDLCNLHNIKLL
jgi:hypothetical protein